jgi:threonine dehydratase
MSGAIPHHPQEQAMPHAGLSLAAMTTAIETAAARIAPWVRRTPLEYSPYLSRLSGAEVHLKLENFQVTSSFKARGAFNALLTLDENERGRGVISSSTGNHANAMAHAMPLLGVNGEIWVPASISGAKLEQLEARGATLRRVADDPGKVEALARAEAARSNRVYVSPYNDAAVIAGQGTVALELLEQLPAFDDVLVPVGGGGLIAGIAAALRERRPRVRVIGVLPENSPVMSESVRAGCLLETPWQPSLSDATVGWAEAASITFPMCQAWVADWLLVSEAQIAAAIRDFVQLHSMLVEGAGALPAAALAANRELFSGRRVVLVVSGARIPGNTLAAVLGATHR